MSESIAPIANSEGKPFFQKVKTCDNSRCHNWHGGTTEEGKQPQFYAALHSDAKVDGSEGSQYELGRYTYTVCSSCEMAVDNFFAMFKQMSSGGPKGK